MFSFLNLSIAKPPTSLAFANAPIVISNPRTSAICMARRNNGDSNFNEMTIEDAARIQRAEVK